MSVSLANDIPLWAAAGLIALCVGLVVWFYRRHSASIPARYMRMLLGLRIAAVVLVLVFFLRPVIIYVHSEGEKSPLVVLMDTSRSMSVKDAPGLPERLERAADALLSSKGLIEMAQKHFKLSLLAFDGDTRGISNSDDLMALEPSGEMTDITGALARAGELTTGSPRPRAIIVTDGNHNATTTSPLDAVPPTLTIDCVGVGIPQGAGQALKDIETGDAVLPERVGLGVKIRVGVRVEAHGYTGRHTRAIIKDAATGKTLGETAFVLDDIVGDQEIAVSITFDSIGRRNLVAEVPVEEDEAITGNNRIPFSVQVTEESLKVLYIEGKLGPEGKFLRRLMLKDPDIEAVLLIRVGRDRFMSQGSVSGTTLSAFPAEKGVLGMFDVFVLNNIPASSLTADQQRYLAELVMGEGKGLLMIAGGSSFGAGGWASTPVAGLLPSSVTSGSAPLTGDFPIAVAAAGKGSPLTEPVEGPVKRSTLPHMELIHSSTPRPGSETLLAVSPKAASAAGEAVLVTAAAGRGRTASLLALPTYTWRSLPGDAYGVFWRGLLRYLAGKDLLKKGEGGILLDVPKPEFTLGETVPISARVRDPAGVLSDTADVTVTWSRRLDSLSRRLDSLSRRVDSLSRRVDSLTSSDSGQGRKVSAHSGTIRLASSGNGEYRASFTPPAVGDYTLEASAVIVGEAVPSAALTFHVGRKDLEFERIGLNKDLLQALAGRTGGTYVSIDSLDALIKTLVEHSEVKERRTTFNPARSWIAFIFLVVLVSLEWYTRRRLELA